MDYAKLLLAAQMRKEILAEMGVTSIKQKDSRLEALNTGTYEERIYDLVDEIIATAKLLDQRIQAG